MADAVTRRSMMRMALAGGLLALAGCSTTLDDYSYTTLSGGKPVLPPHPASSSADGVKFTFLPVVGAPTNQGDDLYREIRRLMARDRLGIVYDLDEATTYRVRLNLTAVATNTWTTLVYTTDIHDQSGRRVHHFGGQIMCSAGTGDPWSGVDGRYLREVAAQIEGGILAWTTRRT